MKLKAAIFCFGEFFVQPKINLLIHRGTDGSCLHSSPILVGV
ncbi:hypothetical protein ADIS_1208 [Lunatimonas lonarensis]|uniref:Uncharacterized protein n=1 Tax=Lunatimonas lonarensis TaxID=1232681 RepID=R7ZW17_9BACT|nr:hypothetical protein ADIS_1208 [Lunatimonas lonarensis]